jgi:hypothetical protein
LVAVVAVNISTVLASLEEMAAGVALSQGQAQHQNLTDTAEVMEQPLPEHLAVVAAVRVPMAPMVVLVALVLPHP